MYICIAHDSPWRVLKAGAAWGEPGLQFPVEFKNLVGGSDVQGQVVPGFRSYVGDGMMAGSGSVHARVCESRSRAERRCLVGLCKFMWLLRYVGPILCKALYVGVRSLKCAHLWIGSQWSSLRCRVI